MNVRDGPLNAGGMVTSVRIDDNSVPVNHGGMTNLVYGDIGIQETNQFKGNENPNIDTLDTAKNQLTDNPYNFFLGKE
jgi:hypothetical protein